MLVFSDASETKYTDIKFAYENWCLTNGKTLHFKNLNTIIRKYHRRGHYGNHYTLELSPTPTQSKIQPPHDPVVTILDENKMVMEFTHDISKHVKKKRKDTTCNIRGCTAQGEWHGPSYSIPHSLCDRHYQMLVRNA
jgi:hypothetical protein